MKMIFAALLASVYLFTAPAFAGDKPADKAAAGDKAAGDKSKDTKSAKDSKKDEKKDEKKAGGGW